MNYYNIVSGGYGTQLLEKMNNLRPSSHVAHLDFGHGEISARWCTQGMGMGRRSGGIVVYASTFSQANQHETFKVRLPKGFSKKSFCIAFGKVYEWLKKTQAIRKLQDELLEQVELLPQKTRNKMERVGSKAGHTSLYCDMTEDDINFYKQWMKTNTEVQHD